MERLRLPKFGPVTERGSQSSSIVVMLADSELLSKKVHEPVIRFYDKRFNIGLTPQEVIDLREFLKVL